MICLSPTVTQSARHSSSIRFRTSGQNIGSRVGQAIARLEKTGALHAANLPVPGRSLTTDKAFADEKETIALMHAGRGRGVAVMRGRAVDKALHNGPLTAGQKDAVKLILSDKDRTVSVQG